MTANVSMRTLHSLNTRSPSLRRAKNSSPWAFSNALRKKPKRPATFTTFWTIIDAFKLMICWIIFKYLNFFSNYGQPMSNALPVIQTRDHQNVHPSYFLMLGISHASLLPFKPIIYSTMNKKMLCIL